MSIRFIEEACIKCGACQHICPGNLITTNEKGFPQIQHLSDCWGCAACVKSCPFKAIRYFLQEDLGGAGGSMYVVNEKEKMTWHIESSTNKQYEIEVVKKESNHY